MGIVENAMRIRHEARLRRAAFVREAIACLDLAQRNIEDACEKLAQGVAAAPSYELTDELNRLDREHPESAGMALDCRIDALRAFLRDNSS